MSDVSFKSVGWIRDHLLALMQERKLDGLFLSSPENVFYGHRVSVLPGSGNPIIHACATRTPILSLLQRRADLSAVLGAGCHGIDYGVEDTRMSFTLQMATDDLAALIEENSSWAAPVGVNQPFLIMQAACWKSMPNRQISRSSTICFFQLRMIKSSAEIELIRQSTKIIDITLMELAQKPAPRYGPPGADSRSQTTHGPKRCRWRGSCHCRLRNGQILKSPSTNLSSVTRS